MRCGRITGKMWAVDSHGGESHDVSVDICTIVVPRLCQRQLEYASKAMTGLAIMHILASGAAQMRTPEVSFVRRLMMRPSGFVWKNDMGALHMADMHLASQSAY